MIISKTFTNTIIRYALKHKLGWAVRPGAMRLYDEKDIVMEFNDIDHQVAITDQSKITLISPKISSLRLELGI